ncbi:envelope protein M [Hedgehog arterivirus]|nr:envelope protein M [Hedgehog arterivirus]
MGLTDYCEQNDGWLAVAFTYAPLFCFLLKYTSGALLFATQLIVFVTASSVFGYVSFTHYSSSGDKVFTTLSVLSAVYWSVTTLYYILSRVYYSCCNCRHGLRYVRMTKDFVVTSEGPFNYTPSHSGALLFKKPGFTAVGSTLVKGVHKIVHNSRLTKSMGRVAVSPLRRK